MTDPQDAADTTDPTHPTDAAGERLAKRLARQLGCSRSQAEQYIENGFVSVDGVVIDTPQFRVADQRVELAANARLAPVVAVTLLLHKPAGFNALEGERAARQLLVPANRFTADASGERTLARHFVNQVGVTPLEADAAGLLVFSQDPRVQRKLLDEAGMIEQEVMVDVAGEVSAEALVRLNRAPVIGGRVLASAKVSLSNQSGASSRLRFAIKGHHPGLVLRICAQAALTVTGMTRTRIGRLPLAGLPLGKWRYLLPTERF